MLLASPDLPPSGAYRVGGFVLLGAIAVIMIALAFEYLGGYPACPLCLQQRYAYYLAIPALFVALSLLAAENTRTAGLVFLAVGIVFLANAGLGAYHAGIEWGYWQGPATCSAEQPLSTSTGGLLKGLERRVIRCDEPQWRFLGLSFAGWNVVMSLALAAGALKAAAGTVRDRA
jgi:disulfide bond formation protein DsbB